jgi:hypothetical protein
MVNSKTFNEEDELTGDEVLVDFSVSIKRLVEE